MKTCIVVAAAGALFGAAPNADAAELMGRIKVINPATNTITLDNGPTFTLATSEEAAMLTMGEKVKITFVKSGSKMIASAVEPAR
jgi:hypothetical protein